MNLQNLPNRDERSDRLKSCIVPKLDYFLFADYASMEVRLLAYFMAISEVNDPSLANQLNAGLDPHKATAVDVYGLEYDDVTAEQRQAAKTCLFSIIYGGGAPTLIRQGIVKTKKEGYALLDRFYSARPGIRAIDLLARSTFESRGFVRSFWGRELRPLSPHKALNYIIQGSGADVTKDAMIKVYDWIEGMGWMSHLVLTIHDELGLDVVVMELVNVATNLPRLMGNEQIDAIVKLEVDLGYGLRWSQKDPYAKERKYG